MPHKLSPPRKDRARAVKRLRAVARALNTGKSNRQIADELGCDEGTVRSDRKKLEKLTPAELEAVLQGEAPHPLLKRAKTTPVLSVPGTPNPRAVISIVDLIFGCLQEEWTIETDSVVRFRGRLRQEHQLQLVPADQERVLEEVDKYWNPLFVAPPPRGERMDIVNRCRPPLPPDLKQGAGAVTFVQWHIDWLRAWLPLIAPDQATLDAALQQARKEVDCEHPRFRPVELPAPPRRRRRTKKKPKS